MPLVAMAAKLCTSSKADPVYTQIIENETSVCFGWRIATADDDNVRSHQLLAVSPATPCSQCLLDIGDVPLHSKLSEPTECCNQSGYSMSFQSHELADAPSSLPSSMQSCHSPSTSLSCRAATGFPSDSAGIANAFDLYNEKRNIASEMRHGVQPMQTIVGFDIKAPFAGWDCIPAQVNAASAPPRKVLKAGGLSLFMRSSQPLPSVSDASSDIEENKTVDAMEPPVPPTLSDAGDSFLQKDAGSQLGCFEFWIDHTYEGCQYPRYSEWYHAGEQLQQQTDSDCESLVVAPGACQDVQAAEFSEDIPCQETSVLIECIECQDSSVSVECAECQEVNAPTECVECQEINAPIECNSSQDFNVPIECVECHTPSTCSALAEPSTLSALAKPFTLPALAEPSTLSALAKPFTLPVLAEPSTLSALAKPFTLPALAEPQGACGSPALAEAPRRDNSLKQQRGSKGRRTKPGCMPQQASPGLKLQHSAVHIPRADKTGPRMPQQGRVGVQEERAAGRAKHGDGGCFTLAKEAKACVMVDCVGSRGRKASQVACVTPRQIIVGFDVRHTDTQTTMVGEPAGKAEPRRVARQALPAGGLKLQLQAMQQRCAASQPAEQGWEGVHSLSFLPCLRAVVAGQASSRQREHTSCTQSQGNKQWGLCKGLAMIPVN